MTEATIMSGNGAQAGVKRLIIDLAKCDQCPGCDVSCSFVGAGHARDKAGLPHGGPVQGLREKVTFALLCRRCVVASCVVACPFDAIERQEHGVIKRYNLRCVSCKSCAHACPFGTIYPEMLTFYDLPYESVCEQCLAGSGEEPACVASCGQGALEYCVPDPAEVDLHILDEYVAARVRKWVKREAGYEQSEGAHP